MSQRVVCLMRAVEKKIEWNIIITPGYLISDNRNIVRCPK